MAMTEEEGEDDYLTMALPSSPPSSSSTTLSSLTRARARAKAAERSVGILSKSALEHDRLVRLERGLRGSAAGEVSSHDLASQASLSTNKGAAMLARMGYKGGALGRSPTIANTDMASASRSTSRPTAHGRTQTGEMETATRDAEGRLLEPLRINLREGRGGIGHAATEHAGVKRARETLEREAQRDTRVKLEAGTYRTRVVSESEERRLEGVWRSAMRTGRTLWEQSREQRDGGRGTSGRTPIVLRPLELEQKEVEGQRLRKARARDFMYAAGQSDDDDDEDDRVARAETLESLPGDARDDEDGSALDEDESALHDYLELSVSERLDKVLVWLRGEYWYCFWCKSRYDDDQLDGCPGLSEDDHEW